METRPFVPPGALNAVAVMATANAEAEDQAKRFAEAASLWPMRRSRALQKAGQQRKAIAKRRARSQMQKASRHANRRR